jgi:ligand-binding sensor domain-containing protein/signal transduction histidine kinase/DNA-binding response OmpR family regulator
MFKYVTYIITLTFILSSEFAFPQAPRLNFKHINREQGLSNSTIQTIFQDSRGFIWIGTQDGLNRYDGYDMVVYRNNPKDMGSISDNDIQCIYEDRNNTIWVGTINGLNQFNANNNTFVRYKHNPTNVKTLANNYINFVYGDKDGDLWICTRGGGLDQFQSKDSTFNHLSHINSDNSSISDNHVNYFYEDSKGYEWVGTDKGLNLFNKKSKTFKLYNSNLSNSKYPDAINLIKEDKEGNLWLGTETQGLILFNPLRKMFKLYQHNENDSSTIAKDQVNSLLFDSNGNLWIGTIDGGLDLYNPHSDTFLHQQNDPHNSNNNLSQLTVSALFEDKQGDLWVGTQRGGINLYTPKADKFQLYRQDLSPNSLSNSDVTVLYQDIKGNIWVGTQLGGMNLFDRETNTFKHFRHDPFNANSIGSDVIIDITEDKEGDFWVGTWGGGLNLFNPKNETFTHFLNDPKDKNSISSDYVQKIFEDHIGNLWVATYYGGLNLFNRKTKKFTRFVGGTGYNGSLSGNNIVSINEDKNKNLWIGTNDGGLNCYDPTTLKFSHYFNKGEKMPNLRVIFNDSKGRLWIGQNGLYLFDPLRKTFSLYKHQSWLSNEFIKGITEDEEGNFWISSTNGLSKFNPEIYTLKKYNTTDGLQGLDFENACLKTKNGEMFFGGLNGFNSFYPYNILVNKFIPPVYITGFQIFNKNIIAGEKNSPLAKDIGLTKTILLSYKQSTFSFIFTALNFSGTENNQYAYKLEGFEKDWNYIGNQRKASYTNIDPGEYTFRIKASNNDGIWNESGASIRIIITPPFWKTWWFVFFIAVIIIGSTYFLLRFKRSLELKELEEKKREEIHQIQLQFFTNISHEFRTPLTLILGSLEKLLEEIVPADFTHYYNLMFRNATRLMGLINELMDFRKAEEGILKLKVMPGDLSLFLSEIAEEFEDFAIAKKITFTVKKPADVTESWFDRQILEKIILNLVHNSFKYTGNGGFVILEILRSLDNFKPTHENELILKNSYRAKNYIYIRVIDSGIGISKNSIHHLFERYYRITDRHLGSGVGLSFVKSLTFLHKGDIFVFSESNKGTEIIIGLPANKEDYNNDERWIPTSDEGGVTLESIDYKFLLPIETESNIPSEHVKHQTKHILVVDDNEELRNFFKESLKLLYIISEAADGGSGLAIAKEKLPDLIISDVMMPGLNGFEFCKSIKENIETSHIPFMMLTAKDTLKSKIEGVESGADFYFEKPVSINLLLLTIRNIFSQKQKLKERYSKDYYLEARELVHSSKDKEFMDKFIHKIELQLIDPELDVDYLCLEIGMSKSKLYRKIKQITGQSIGEFIRTIRLKKAVQIMTHEDVFLTEVMFRVGIQTQSYFTKAFKKEFGKTPSQFLNEIKQPIV